MSRSLEPPVDPLLRTDAPWLVEVSDYSLMPFFVGEATQRHAPPKIYGQKERVYLQGFHPQPLASGVLPSMVVLTSDVARACEFGSSEDAAAARDIYLNAAKNMVKECDDGTGSLVNNRMLAQGDVGLCFDEVDDVFFADAESHVVGFERKRREERLRQCQAAAQSSADVTRGYVSLYRVGLLSLEGENEHGHPLYGESGHCLLGSYLDDKGVSYVGLALAVHESHVVRDVGRDRMSAQAQLPVLLPCSGKQTSRPLGDGVLCLVDGSMAPGSRVDMVMGKSQKLGGRVLRSGWDLSGGDYELTVEGRSEHGMSRGWTKGGEYVNVKVDAAVMDRMMKDGSYVNGRDMPCVEVIAEQMEVGGDKYERIVDWRRSERVSFDEYVAAAGRGVGGHSHGAGEPARGVMEL